MQDTLPDVLLRYWGLHIWRKVCIYCMRLLPSYTIQQLSDGALPAWQRLKFDELLAQQLSMRLARQKRMSGQTKAIVGDGRFQQMLLQALPFQLTGAQATGVAGNSR